MNERDDLDELLLRENRIAELLAAYYPVVVARLRMRLPAGVVYDVAQDVAERLIRELRRGKRYPVPFRVVVHQVTGYCVGDYAVTRKKRLETPLPPDWVGWERYVGHDDGEAERILSDDILTRLCEGLPPRDREIAIMRLGRDMEIADIAAELKIGRNAVDQSIHRIRKRFRGMYDHE